MSTPTHNITEVKPVVRKLPRKKAAPPESIRDFLGRWSDTFSDVESELAQVRGAVSVAAHFAASSEADSVDPGAVAGLLSLVERSLNSMHELLSQAGQEFDERREHRAIAG